MERGKPARGPVEAGSWVTRSRHPDLAEGGAEAQRAVAGEWRRAPAHTRSNPAGAAVLAPRAGLTVAGVEVLAELSGVAGCAAGK